MIDILSVYKSFRLKHNRDFLYYLALVLSYKFSIYLLKKQYSISSYYCTYLFTLDCVYRQSNKIHISVCRYITIVSSEEKQVTVSRYKYPGPYDFLL